MPSGFLYYLFDEQAWWSLAPVSNGKGCAFVELSGILARTWCTRFDVLHLPVVAISSRSSGRGTAIICSFGSYYNKFRSDAIVREGTSHLGVLACLSATVIKQLPVQPLPAPDQRRDPVSSNLSLSKAHLAMVFRGRFNLAIPMGCPR